MTRIRRFVENVRGTTSIEYALIAVFLSVLIVVGATAIGTQLTVKFTKVSGNLN